MTENGIIFLCFMAAMAAAITPWRLLMDRPLLVFMIGLMMVGLFGILATCIDAHAEVFVNDKQVSSYSVTYKPNGEIRVDTVPADWDCVNFGGAPFKLGDNFNYHGHHIGYIPFKHTGSGRFVVTATQKVNAGVSKCPAGFWENNCGFSANSGTIRLDRCNTLVNGKTYYLNIRQPDCNSQVGGWCAVKITR